MSDEAPPRPHHVDLRDPARWQMAVRVFLGELEPEQASAWLDGIRLISTMAGRLIRDRMHMQLTNRCYICKRPFKDGKPAGEAFYYDADRVCIKTYICDQSEYNDLLKQMLQKERDVADANEQQEKAARQALIDIRQRKK